MGLWAANVRDRARVLGNDASVRDWIASVRDGSCEASWSKFGGSWQFFFNSHFFVSYIFFVIIFLKSAIFLVFFVRILTIFGKNYYIS